MIQSFFTLALVAILFTACGNKTTAEAPVEDTIYNCYVDTVPATNDEPVTATEPIGDDVNASVVEAPEPVVEEKVEKPKYGRCECTDCFASDMETRVRCKEKGKLTKAGYRCESCRLAPEDYQHGGGCDGACED